MTKSEFHKKWLEHFARDIPKQQLKNLVDSTERSLWYIFLLKFVELQYFSEGAKARSEYNKIDKRGAIYIEWFKDEKAHDITRELNTAEDLDKMDEVYVVARDFSWTYIKPAKPLCEAYGPYFMKI